MGRNKIRPAWLSRLKQVGDVLKVQKGSESPPSQISQGSGDESPGSAFSRKSRDAPELARSLSLRRAKARAESSRSDGDGGPPTSGHQLSRSIDALYALSQRKGESEPEQEQEQEQEQEEEQEVEQRQSEISQVEQVSGRRDREREEKRAHVVRDLDRATMALLKSSLKRSKIPRHKELAARALRATAELKAKTRVLVSDDSASVASDNQQQRHQGPYALTAGGSAGGGGRATMRRRSASDLPRPNWTSERHYKHSQSPSVDFETDSVGTGQPEASVDGRPSFCTSEDGWEPAGERVDVRSSDDGWENGSRGSRQSRSALASVTGSEDGWDNAAAGAGAADAVSRSKYSAREREEVWDSSSRVSDGSELRGSWGSDLFGKLRALSQFRAQAAQADAEAEGEEESDPEGSSYLEDDGWATSGESSGASPEREWGTPGRREMGTPGRGTPGRKELGLPPIWTPGRTEMDTVKTPSRREMGSPSRRELESPTRRTVGSPGRREEAYHYQYDDYDADHKVGWRGDLESNRKAAKSRAFEVKQKQGRANLSCLLPSDISGVVRESVAMVKYSQDPYADFRHSMLEMILEKDIHQSDDLEELLHCYLSLNSPRQYALIKRAFCDTWNELLARRSRTFWGAV